MSNVLFINGPASGHVYPTLGLVEELIADGEQVVYVSSEEYRTMLEKLGATFVAYDNFLGKEDPFETIHYIALVNKILASYDVILPCIFQLMNEYNFNYIIQDSMYGCGNALSDFLRIPCISTCTSFIHAERLSPEHTGNPKEFKENLFLIKEFVTLSKRISAKFGIQRRLDINEVFFNEGALNLVFTSEYLQPHYEKLDSRFKFVGPSITDRENPYDFPFERIRAQKTVYISLGTVFNNVPTFYELCFEALSSFDGQVVLSVGSRIDISTFHGVPEHFIVRPFVPQLEILRYTDVFVTHGGMNSVNEALYYDVPLIVVPMAADQPIVGNRISELGAGKNINSSQLSAELLRESINEILRTDDYKKNSAKIGESLRNAGGKWKAMEEIRLFKKSHGIA